MRQDNFSRLYAEHRDALRGLAMRCCGGDRATSDDLLQDTYERAWRSYASLHDPRSALAWLAAILRNRWRSACRRTVRVLPTADLPDMPAVDDELSPWQQLTLDDVHRAINGLDEPYRSVAAMHDFDHLSHASIARRLSIPYATAVTRLHRARNQLRRTLQAGILAVQSDYLK